MQYEVVQKSLGTNTVKILHVLDVPLPVQDMCYVPETGIVFVYDSCLGLISTDNKIHTPWIGAIGHHEMADLGFEDARFNHPSSICYDKHTRFIYVVEDFGRTLRYVSLRGKEVCGTYRGTTYEVFIRSLFPKNPKVSMGYVCSNIDGIVYWTVPPIHRCFAFSGSRPSPFIGTGVAGYSISTRKEMSQIHTPMGIAAEDRTVVLVDAGNRCVREIKEDSITLVAGRPPLEKKITQTCEENTNLLYNPSKLVLDQNVSYILDNNVIKSYHRPTVNNVTSIASTQGAETMCLDEKRNLIWMRRAHEREGSPRPITDSH